MSVYHSGRVSQFQGQSPSFGTPYARWQDWMSLMLGAWLFVAPWAMDRVGGMPLVSAGVATNGWGIGIVLVSMSVWALCRPAAAVPEWISMVCGAWLCVSPWALGLVGSPQWASMNDWIVGAAIFALAISAARHTRRAIS